jgi:preprotein translocase subunit SecA
MDSLKDSVSLRGYGQRDPLQEYKKEGFRLFSEMMARIEEESATALISIEIPDQPVAQAAPQQLAEDDELDNMTDGESEDDRPAALPGFSQPQPAAPAAPRLQQAAAGNGSARPAPGPGSPIVPQNRREVDDSKLIYHGSRAQPQEAPKKTAQTVKREAEKVGRNDPCPCGSGKKYKKCHGAAAGEESAL